MTTIALTRPLPPHRPSSAIGPISTIPLESISPSQAVVPNKHIPTCPPGPPTPGDPEKTNPLLGDEDDHAAQPSSLLYPPRGFPCRESDSLRLFEIKARDVTSAIDHIARQPLPDPSLVFPWFHGLHSSNHIQQAFFIARRKTLRRTPSCVRGLTVIKADGDLTVARLKGAVTPREILDYCPDPEFIDVDPKDGFSVRNFQIQATKSATLSDIVIYGTDPRLVHKLGWDVATAQLRWREKHEAQGHPIPEYNTFICVDPFGTFEKKHPEVVAIDSRGRLTGNVVDLFYQERKEMYTMAKSSEIARNVWLGPTPDPSTDDGAQFDILIECSDVGRMNPAALKAIAQSRKRDTRHPYLDFPSSGSISPPTWSHAEADGILETCRWIYHLAHGTFPGDDNLDIDGDTDMEEDEVQFFHSRRPMKILIHCPDGYTESTMLGIAYFSYSTGRGIPGAWLALHTEKRRNFFAYPSDVALLTCIEPRLLRESPVHSRKRLSEIDALIREPPWFHGLDGSLPSRILDYMYLGNLTHANNPDLLRALGIGQILSVGETATWRDGELQEWGPDKVCVIQGVQDNGIDPLTHELERCLKFIERGRRNGTATLVHCRVGVSRSATICIAEVMRELDLSFPRAYCFVRARRLNVIIQPHLRFVYELLKWEEELQTRKNGGAGFKRELEWGEIAREIALMNRPYAR
ncbi:hypothetical protein ACRALDRAFT_1033410 [Sodiomyces alcalophilus JCM 7366]|uniref:uncharacterized protein n=1 Tax=Sodiomyces alcalophilus JCM 7366 TaxID=591952 RepID=UPI0039B67B87